MDKSPESRPTALITGAARRIGAGIAGALHAEGMNVIVHYHRSQAEARQLLAALNRKREASAHAIRADLQDTKSVHELAQESLKRWGRLDALINNASAFEASSLENLDDELWDRLIDTNLKAPLFLCGELAAELQRTKGCIINISDIHAQRPLKNYLLYCISKAGVDMLTKALARELATAVRCNAVAPGAIAWPQHDHDTEKQQAVVKKIALKRVGTTKDIAQAVLFLIRSRYITGQIINVDGGRTLSQ